MNPIVGTVKNYQDLFLNNPRKAGKSTERPKDSLASIAFNESFDISYKKKFVDEEKNRRNLNYTNKQNYISQKREAKILQEAGRWQATEDDYQRSMKKIEIQKSLWNYGQKNNKSEPFNLITLDYDHSQQGMELREKDNLKRQREHMRFANFYSKMNSGYNVITGVRRFSSSIQSYY